MLSLFFTIIYFFAYGVLAFVIHCKIMDTLDNGQFAEPVVLSWLYILVLCILAMPIIR
jgi:hypothetical protein